MILKAVADLGLPMANCRGQSYDGAGNMAGKYNGVSSLIQGQFSKALYVHCMNHRLNLCVADTCSEYLVKDMMSVVRSLSSFFSGSPKRQQHLKEKVKSLLPASKHEVLINVCETRWIARLDGLDRIVELLLPVVCMIEDIAHNRKGGGDEESGDWNQNSKAAAKKMLPSITFQFVVTLVIVRYILDLTRPATVKLQRKEMDLLKAHSEISSLKKNLQDLRSNIDREHHKLYQEAVELAATIGLDPCKSRIIPVQAHRNNNPSDSIEGHYRVNLSVVFLDHALNQLETRFPPEAYTCYSGFSIVPTVMLANQSTWKNSVTLFCQHYSSDIPNVIGLPAELTLWQRRWEDKVEEVGIDKLPDRVSKTLISVDPVSFPNIFTVLKILATIPVTSCSCERSISSLRLLKNYLRNTTGQERLNGLTLMHAHKAISLDYEKIIDLFATLHPRRMRMVHILCSDD